MCNVQKMHIAFCVEFPLVKNIIDVLGYNSSIPLEQIAHLSLGQPYGFIGKKNIQLYYAVLGFVYYNLIIHKLIKTSATGSVRNKVTLCGPTSEAESISFRESVTNHRHKGNQKF